MVSKHIMSRVDYWTHTMIDDQYKTTAALLRKARQDPDPVSCFANGSNWSDTQEAVFIVKGKRKVHQAFAALVAAGLLTSNPVTPNLL